MECSIDGCSKTRRGHGYCSSHYMRWWRYGDPTVPLKTTKAPADGRCKLDDCARKHVRYGYCDMHSKRYKKYGDPYNKGVEDGRDPITGRLVKGMRMKHYAPIGTIVIRHRRTRPLEKRRFIKTSEYDWMPYARWLWEKHNGPIPSGMHIHHVDHDKLNDTIENLMLLTVREHAEIHRKNDYTNEQLHAAAMEKLSSIVTYKELSVRTGIPVTSISAKVQKLKKHL